MNLRITAITTTIALTMATSAWSDVSVDKENVQAFFGYLQQIEEEIKIDISEIKGFEGVIHSPCGDIESTVYCTTNATIYVEMNQMNHYINTYGENSFYIIIGHEWGHHLLSQAYNYTGPRIGEELAADCLSGYLFANFNNHNNWEISQDELTRSLALINSTGDGEAFITDHGLGEQRTNYFIRGLKAGLENTAAGDVCLR